jgi:hypothetical protein
MPTLSHRPIVGGFKTNRQTKKNPLTEISGFFSYN